MVDAVRGVVVVSTFCGDSKLYVYSLADGSLVRSFGGKGTGKGQFDWYFGGLCTTPRGTLLVADSYNNRVQEVSLDDGSWVRFVGEGVLQEPNYVHCSESVIAVSETREHRLTLLSWMDGSLLARFGGEGSTDGRLKAPRGLRLLASGGGVVVADKENNRLCIFSTTGAFLRSLPAGRDPCDVAECDGGTSFVVANAGAVHTLSKVSSAAGTAGGVQVVPFGKEGSKNCQFNWPVAVATIPGAPGGGGMEVLVLEYFNKRFQVFQA